MSEENWKPMDMPSAGKGGQMRLVAIESSFAGDALRNLAYLRACMKDCLMRGESPYASHGLLTQVLDDSVPSERELGIVAGFHWADKADLRAIYVDCGLSAGVRRGILRAIDIGQPIEFRSLPEWKPSTRRSPTRAR